MGADIDGLMEEEERDTGTTQYGQPYRRSRQQHVDAMEV